MEIQFITGRISADLIVKSGNAKIEEDITKLRKGEYYIPSEIIEKFITIAREMNWFNGQSDIEFVKNIYENLLNDSEREEFLDIVR